MLLSLAVAAGTASARSALAGNVKVQRVVTGSAQFQQVGEDTIIHAANKTIINYTQFNIAAGTSVQFVQPGSTSWVLNRIVTAAPSQIDGMLTANGIVYLVNPAGVMFGKNSIIDVGQLYAAAANLSNQDALSGLNHFTAAQGSVINQGTITAGDAYLVGLHVVNGGSILAGSGTVALVSGNDVYLSNGAGGLMVKIDAAANSPAPSGVGVDNSGNIAAQVADMSAGDLYSVAIRQTGQTKASNITLNAAGAVNVSGSLDASNSGGTGGTVKVFGDQIALTGAKINTSGSTGGGTVWIGGGPHGSGDVPTAKTTVVDADSSIDANAVSTGNGGTVVVWSDSNTIFNGAISIRGGADSGNGGWAEVSSADLLGFAGRVDAQAPHGNFGTLLLDPHTITVASGGSAQLTDVDSFSNTSDETIDAGTIDAASANVILQANTDIDINQDIDIPTSGITLTMQAGRSIVFASGINVTTTNGDILLSANDPGATLSNRDAGAATISMDSSNTISAGTGNITLSVGSLSTAGALTAGNLTTTGNVTLTNASGNVNVAGAVSCNVFSSTGQQIVLDFESSTASPIVTSTGSQTYSGPVSLAADAALTSNGGGAITFDSTIDGAFNLTVNSAGAMIFGGVIGGSAPLASVTTDDPTSGITTGTDYFNAAGTSAAPSVATTAGQTFNNPVQLGANSTFTDTGGSTITFGSTINGGFALTVNSGGAMIFGGIVGGTTPLASLTTDDPTSGITTGTTYLNATGTTAAPSIVTIAGQTYNNPIELGANTTFTDTGGGNITFNSTVDGAFSMTVNTAGTTTFTDDVGQNTQLTSVLIDDPASGITGGPVICTFDGISTHPTILTTAGQTYNSPIVMQNATAFDDVNGGNITFNSTVNGAFPLSVTTSGTISFNGRLGGTTPLASVETDDPATNIPNGTTEFNAVGTTAAPSVVTTGGQIYNDPIVLGANTTFADTGGGDITFDSTVDGAFSMTVNTAGTTTFADDVGQNVQLTTVLIDDPASGIIGGPVDCSFDGVATHPTILTTAGQTYNTPIVLQNDTAFDDVGGGTILFTSTINGAFALSLNTTGSMILNGLVGNTTPVTSVKTDEPATNINNGITVFGAAGTSAAPSVITTGGQTYNNPVTLNVNTVVTDTGGSDITFDSTIDGASSLTVNTAGNTTIAGAVGNGTPLTSLTINDPASGITGGTTTLAAAATSDSTPSILTTGSQTYNNAVTLTAETLLVAEGGPTGPGSVTFNSTLDGGNDFEVDSSYKFTGTGALTNANGGTITFGNGGADFIGSNTPLTSLTTFSAPAGTGTAGTTILNIVGTSTPSIQVTASVGFENPVVLDAATKITSTGGDIDMASAITGAFALDLDTSSGGNNIVLEGTANVASLSADSGVSVLVSDVTTTGNISLQPDSSTGAGANGANDVRPGGVIILAGNLTSTGGDVDLSLAGRTAVTSVATIADDPSTANNVSIQALGLTMGNFEKMTVLGNLTINVGSGTATLGDINTGGSLSVTAGRAVFQLRPPGFLLTSSDNLVSEAATGGSPAGGTDVVVLGPNLTFNVGSITTTGTGTPPRFATVSGLGTVPGFKIVQYSPEFGTSLLDPNATPLDLQARSFTIESLANSLPTSLPPVSQQLVGYGVSSTMDLEPIFELYLGDTAANNGPPRGDAAIFVHELQSLYCVEVAIGPTGHPIYSSQIDPDKVALIRQDLTAAVQAYRAAYHVEGLEPTTFEQFLETSSNPAAVQTFDRLKRLRQLLDLISNSDLSIDVQERLQGAVLQPFRTAEVTDNDLSQAAFAIGRAKEFHPMY